MQEKTFKIGLVMAGAISAGAYTAGVVDYLLQALKEWDKAKNEHSQKAPPHNVQLKVITGSSAGGMTGAILSSMINGQFEAITSLPKREPNQKAIEKNELYRAWVEQIDISKLLGHNDLRKRNSKVISLLDSTVLDKIAQSSIQFQPSDHRLPFIANDLHLYLTLTNLYGIPYDITFKGQSGKGQTLTKHTDYFHFQLSNNNPGSDNIKWLDANNSHQHNWDVLKKVALATGAFPGGFAPRLIDRPFADYNNRLWPIPQQPDDNAATADDCVKMEQIIPNWPPHDQDQFQFLSVDGGVMDNEPIELARRELAGDDLYNPRSAEEVCRSLILIDPFPSEQQSHLKKDETVNRNISHVLMKLFGSLKAQSRFNPDELILANSDDVYNRFLIAPTRRDKNGTVAKHPMASGSLHGFGGFLSKKFRMHDFQLGRRNCQQFLKKYFAIPVEKAKQNPIFSSYNQDDFQRFSFQQNGQPCLPIIPLLGNCKKEEQLRKWQTLQLTEAELRELQHQITGRTKVVVNHLIDQHIQSGFARTGAKFIAWIKRDNMVNKMMEIIKRSLKKFDLF